MLKKLRGVHVKKTILKPLSIRIFCFVFFSFILLNFNSTTKAFAKLPSVESGKPLPSNIFIELNKAVNPSVVNIFTESSPKKLSRGEAQDPMEELFRQFFGGQLNQRGGQGSNPFNAGPERSLGTGFIIKENGLILTNSHVVASADIIKVKLSGDKDTEYSATLIGKDSKTDIALIKIKAPKKLPAVKLGESSTLKVGEWVSAFGNPFGHSNSMSKGIVSAMGRDLDNINLLPFIQTDASINPGNSGGPLVNLKGEVIGVNTAIDARAQGIGFAIPIDEIKPLIAQLEETGSVKRGFLGVEMQGMNPYFAKQLGLPEKTEGALVANVVAKSAADRAGLKPYDVIVKFDKKEIKTPADLSRAVSRAKIGSTKDILVFRQGKKVKLKTSVGNTQTPEVALKNSPSPSYPKKTQSKTLLKVYGLDLSELTRSLKKEFEIKNTGKHQVVVKQVLGYSRASRAGIRAGDVIYEINTKPIYNLKEAKQILGYQNTSFLIRIKRGDMYILARLE